MDLVPAGQISGRPDARLTETLAEILERCSRHGCRPPAPSLPEAGRAGIHASSFHPCGPMRDGRKQAEEFDGYRLPANVYVDGGALCASPAPGVLARSGAVRSGPVRPGAAAKEAGIPTPTCPSPPDRAPASAPAWRCWKPSLVLAQILQRFRVHVGPGPSHRDHGQGHAQAAPRHSGHLEPPVASRRTPKPYLSSAVHSLHQESVRPRVSTRTSRAPERSSIAGALVEP